MADTLLTLLAYTLAVVAAIVCLGGITLAIIGSAHATIDLERERNDQ